LASSKAANLKASVDALFPLLTECNARRLARATDSAAGGSKKTDPAAIAVPVDSAAGGSKKTNPAAIAVPVVAVLMLAAVVATVVVMRSRGGGNAPAMALENAPPATQPNPTFEPPGPREEVTAAPVPSFNVDTSSNKDMDL
jgi:hypothetical protein